MRQPKVTMKWTFGPILVALGLGLSACGGSPAASKAPVNQVQGDSGTVDTTTTTTTAPALTQLDLPAGTAAGFTKNGQPYYSVTMTQFVNPAQPDNH